jgi:hypothetical protein
VIKPSCTYSGYISDPSPPPQKEIFIVLRPGVPIAKPHPAKYEHFSFFISTVPLNPQKKDRFLNSTSKFDTQNLFPIFDSIYVILKRKRTKKKEPKPFSKSGFEHDFFILFYIFAKRKSTGNQKR